MNDNRDIENALRASLERHAREAPQADLLAERVIRRSLDPRPAASRRREWRTWALPVLASGAVAAVVIGVLASTEFNHQATNGHGTKPGNSISGSASSPSLTQTSSQSVAPPPANTVGLTAFRVADLTFVTADRGWALGTADCLDGSGTGCSAIVHTTDGKTWSAGTTFSTPFHVGINCTDPCVDHIRFATNDVGYVFGSSAFFMTTDGGKTWKSQKGGAIALESLDDNVIRITATSDSGCPGPCGVGVETSAIGSATWTPSQLPGGTSALQSLRFVRGNGGYAYLLAMRNPAGGANDATSTLYRSKDRGATWTNGGEPCPQGGSGEVDSRDVAGGDKGAVTVLCATRQAPNTWSVATSSNGGATFAATSGAIPADTAGLLAGDPSTELLTGGTNGLSRSTDGGASWTGVGDVTGTVTFLGFESAQVGRCVTDGGRIVWTTTDGGLTWSAFTFH